ncbi:MAG TPA: efflux RND transporter permease subunit [Candidatus Hydrogenedentes bacterium]|jgi:HAE1 family hydrophobic/amphiphilic exporter-1|nr:efflux RND transporter permease subunit [Candidatus Hydrogenedentota bacterium]HPK24076.1 efflux RND transporter permease subunit [Candidatus Hydrogenedentota bacterium]
MKSSLAALALKRPIMVTMLTITMVGLGIISWYRLPLNFLPRAESPFMVCIFPYPGAAPSQVEQQVAIPVEGEFRTLSGLTRLRTNSTDSACYAEMNFSLETDLNQVSAEIRDRIERLKLVLPKEVEKVQLQRFNVDAFPVMAVGLFSHGDREEFTHKVRTIVEPRLRRLDGVASIQVHSPTQPREVLIEFEQDTLTGLNLSMPEIIQYLQIGTMTISLGELTDDAMRYIVRYEGEYRSIEAIADLPIGKQGLHLRDIATVRFSSRSKDLRATMDGADGLVLFITKESQANTVDTCRSVREELDKLLLTPAFSGARVLPLFDQSEFIVKALNNLFLQGLYGSIMAVGVLFVFMHRFLPTALVALSIPSSLVFALVFMFFTGMSLNIITMVSMIVAVGMLVDNAIVVVENILRHRSLGLSIREAVVKGPQEVSLAIIASTVTTWVVFLPMFYMKTGQMSVFMEQLGEPLIAALGGSLLGALTLIPLLMVGVEFLESRVKRRTAKIQWGSWTKLPGKIVDACVDAYGVALRHSLRQRFVVILLVLLAVLFTALFPMKTVGMRTLPKLDMREVTVDVSLARNFGMDRAVELFKSLEAEIDQLREVLAVKYVLAYHGATGGAIHVYLYTEDDGPIGEDPPYTTQEVLDILSEKLPHRLPGATINFTSANLEDPSAESGVRILLRGDDSAVLAQYARTIGDTMTTIESLRNISVNIDSGQQEMQVLIDAPRARTAGLTPMIIAQTVDAALRGVRMPFLKQDGREIPVWAQFREEDRRSQANLENIALQGLNQQLTPLSRLTNFSKAPSPRSIRRLDGKNVLSISAKTDSNNLMEVKAELKAMLDNIDLPPMYSYSFGDEFNELEDNLLNFSLSMTMAVILVYLVMCALFESFILPFTIMTTVPLAMIGAIWLLYLTNTSFDSISLIGCILMAGVIVNNGIVIVDHMRNTCKEFAVRDDGIVKAGKDRFKPVLMTAITTILGLVPVAIATTGGASTFAGLGRTLIGGLSVGTVLTLFIVPIFYGLLDDLSIWLRNFMASVQMLPLNAETEPERPAAAK